VQRTKLQVEENSLFSNFKLGKLLVLILDILLSLDEFLKGNEGQLNGYLRENCKTYTTLAELREKSIQKLAIFHELDEQLLLFIKTQILLHRFNHQIVSWILAVVPVLGFQLMQCFAQRHTCWATLADSAMSDHRARLHAIPVTALMLVVAFHDMLEHFLCLDAVHKGATFFFTFESVKQSNKSVIPEKTN